VPEPVFLLASAIVFVSFFIRALTGFGAGLIGIPLLALFWNVSFVVPMQLLLEIGISVLLLPKVHKDVDYRHVGNLAVGMFLGNLAGSLALASFEGRVLKPALAVVVLLFSIYLAVTTGRPNRWSIHPKWGFLFGLCGGFFGGAFGMSGPIVMLYLTQQIRDKTRLRATVIALFFLASSWTAVMHLANGLYSLESLRVLAILTPAFLCGTLLGHWAHFRVSEVLFRRIIAAILLGSSIMLLTWKN